mgnify:CR=1 FL=1
MLNLQAEGEGGGEVEEDADRKRLKAAYVAGKFSVPARRLFLGEAVLDRPAGRGGAGAFASC